MFQYFLVHNNEFIGSIEIKPELEKMNEEWQKYGGHISYQIFPHKRRKGYGSKILNLGLKKCLELGLKEVFVNCLEENIGSWKVIENNYGVLEKIIRYNGKLKPKDLGKNYKIYKINLKDIK